MYGPRSTVIPTLQGDLTWKLEHVITDSSLAAPVELQREISQKSTLGLRGTRRRSAF